MFCCGWIYLEGKNIKLTFNVGMYFQREWPMIRRSKNAGVVFASKAVAIALLCTLTSCIDLSQITTFSSTAKQAGTALPALVSDLKSSCERFNSYAPPGSAARDCSQYDAQSKGISAVQSVLLNYMQALGQLSSDKAVTFSQGTSDLATSLKNAGLDEAASKATTGLAGKLADAVTNGYRRKKLAQFVHSENGDVQILTTGLANIIGNDYKQVLDNEKTAMESYYKRALLNQDREPLTAVLVQHQWLQDESSLKAKMDAADAYAKIMKSIADGHQKLNNAGTSLNTKDLLQILGKDIGDIASSVTDVNKAFK